MTAEAVAEGQRSMPGYDNGKRILWWLVGLLGTIIVGMLFAYATLIRNVVTQDELSRQLTPINEKVDKLIREQEQQATDLDEMKIDIAVIKEKIATKGAK
jgi:hypothetical protein